MLKTIVSKKKDYFILFNTETGLEIRSGLNGKKDPDVLEFPCLLDIGVMGRCLNTCSFCYQGENKSRNMSFEDFKKIIDESSQYVNQVALGGKGDPNLHENFKEIVEYCRSKNIVPNYTTSGNGLTREQIEISKLCGAVAVSDYDQDFSHDAVSKFVSSGIKTNIHFLLSKSRLERAKRLLKGKNIWNKKSYFKINAVVFLSFKPKGRAKNQNHEVLSIQEIKEFAEQLFSTKVPFKVGLDSCTVNKIQKIGMFTKEQEVFVDTCEASRVSAYIDQEMKLFPCSFCDQNYGISIRDRGIENVWNNDKMFISFREKLLQEPTKCPLEEEWKTS